MEVALVAEALVYIDHSDIRPGNVEEIKRGATALVEFVRTHEPQLIFYGFSIDDEAQIPTMTVVAVHPDSASLELHMEIGKPEFQKLADFLDLRAIEVYGRPTKSVLRLLGEKAQMLGANARVVVHDIHAGFAHAR